MNSTPKTKKNKKKKIIICLLILIIMACIVVTTYFLYFKKEESLPEPIKVEVLDKIAGYEYNLEDRDTSLYKEKFLQLKELLESEEIDYEEYAKILAELFVIDLYTIENKISKYDVGSLEFIYPEEQEKFKNKVMDSIYKLVEDNSTNTRKQDLPVVSNVVLSDLKEASYKKGNSTLSGYKVNVTISYEKDLKYDKEVSITLVQEENRIYVVNISPVE